MSGVEDVIHPPPDDHEKSIEKEEIAHTIDEKEEDKASLTTSLTDSDSASLTGSTSESWTLLEKEEDDAQKKTIIPVEGEVSIIGNSVEDIVDQADDHTLKSPVEETDSESIETISDDECLVSHPLSNSIHANLASFCYIPDLTDSGFPSSLTSTTSTISVASDGIPIVDKSPEEEDGQLQYEWNSEGEKPIPEEEILDEDDVESVGQVAEVEDDAVIEDDEEVDEEEEVSHEENRERSLEPSEPGYDVDDDGLPGAPLAPLVQEVDLYPSQELDPSFPIIKRGEVYKHDKNLQLDHFLTAFVILALALVIGLGIGHFLGLFLSVTTSIHSSLFGLAPDPFEQNLEMEMDPGMIDSVGGIDGMFPFPDNKEDNPTIDSLAGEPDNIQENNLPGDEFIDDFRSVNDFDISPEENDKFKQQLQEPVEPAESFSIIGAIKNVFTRLGTKFGYIKKSVNPETVVHAATGSEVYYEFQCMSADDQPILINGEPVMVSEPHDCHQFFTKGQGEGHASITEPPPIYMESARTAFKSDDQDLDDRVIRQLWDENQDLRDQVHQMRTNVGDQGDEAMAAILRDRINDLLTANADLEREVARLRYADAARGAAESVETLNKLRKTRDTLNDIVTENDQLKIEVAKARYGEPPAHISTKAERDQLANENQELKSELEKLKLANHDYKNKASEKMHEKFENALKYLEELAVDKHITPNNNLKQDDLSTPWPSKRHEELKTEDEGEAEILEDKDDEVEDDDDDNDEKDNDDDDDDDDGDEIKSKSMNNLSKYLSGLVGVGSKILTKQGTIDWVQAKKFVGGLKEDLSTKFEEAGKLAKEDIGIIVNKFDDLKKFVNTEKVKQNMKATQTAAGKLVKSLVGAVKDLKEASEDAAEKSDWINKFKTEANKVKSGLETKWYEIKDKWQKVVVQNEQKHKEDDNDDDDDDNDDDNNKEKQKKGHKKSSDYEDDDDDDEKEEYNKNKSREDKQKIKIKQWSDDDDDEGYHSYDDQKKRKYDDNNDKKYRKRNKRDDDDEEDRDKERKHSKSRRDDSKNRKNWTKENKTDEVDDENNWAMKRGEERDKMRRGEERADWIFERAKHRKDARHEETRGDWYFERKEHGNSEQKESHKPKRDYCDKYDDECNNSRKKSSRYERRGERFNSYDDEDEKDMFNHKREYSTKGKFNQKMKSEQRQRGERFTKKEKKHRNFKKNNGKTRGETNKWDDDDDKNDENSYKYYNFDEEVQYAERHYTDESGKNRHEKRAKRRLSKRENEKKFVIEADFNQFY